MPNCRIKCSEVHPKIINLSYHNIQGLMNKLNILQVEAMKQNLDIICITEHWLKSDVINLACIPNYKVAAQFCRKNKRHGGSAILIKSEFTYKDVPRICKLALEEIFELSACFIEELQILIVCFYRVPDIRNKDKFFDRLIRLLNLTLTMNVDIIITGDFNIDVNVIDTLSTQLLSIVESFGMHVMLKNVITRPGIIHEGKCIDNIITNIHTSKSKIEIIDVGYSDHYSVNMSVLLDSVKIKSEVSYKTFRPINESTINAFLSCLNDISWLEIYRPNHVEEQFSIFFQIFLWVINSKLPEKTVKLSNHSRRHTNNKWYTTELSHMKEQFKIHSALIKKTSCLQIRERLKKLKYNYRMEINKAKITYNNKLVAQAINKPREIWKIINNSSTENSKRPDKIPLILSPNKFNNFFIDNIDDIIKNIPASKETSNHYLSKAYNGSVPLRFFFQHVTVQDVHSVILSLNNSNCSDIYNINSFILKYSSNYISEVLCHLINNCFDTGYFPNELKQAKVIPVHKKGDKNECSNYRPISLVPTLSKVFERIMSHQMTKFLDSNNLLFGRQFGFRKNHSTCGAVMNFIQDCLDGKENNFSINAKFFDLSKAFDTVCHLTLLHKLNSIGFSAVAIKLIKSYLTNRMQTTFVNDSFSDFKQVSYGVPQGSILGPLLFVIYINDLPKNIESNNVQCYLYADDICITSKIMSNTLNTFSVESLKDWCNANSLSINLEKTQELAISYDKRIKHHLNVKFLGILVQDNLSWQSHIDYILPKINKGTFIIRKLSNMVSIDVLLTVYYGYVHSHLTYGTILWANCSYSNSIFSAQKQALRALTKLPPRSHCKPVFIQFKIMSLPCIYIFQCLLYVKKNLINLKQNSDIHNYNTRHKNDLKKNHCIYSKTINSFQETSIRLFNKLPFQLRNSNMSSFRNKIKIFLIENCFYNLDEYLQFKF
jgi:exonuclease III